MRLLRFLVHGLTYVLTQQFGELLMSGGREKHSFTHFITTYIPSMTQVCITVYNPTIIQISITLYNLTMIDMLSQVMSQVLRHM